MSIQAMAIISGVAIVVGLTIALALLFYR